MSRRVGRPKDHARAGLRAEFPTLSERSFASLYKAHKSVSDLGAMINDELWIRRTLNSAKESATRPNGSFNVSRFVRECEAKILDKLVELEESGEDIYQGYL